MKYLTSLKRAATLFGLAGSFLLMSTPCQALNFTWEFTNAVPPGDLGSDGDLIAGTILGLNEGWNFQVVTVTFDTVNGGAPSDGIGPQVWSSNITANVTGGVITSFSFSNNNGAAAILLSDSAAEFVSNDGYTHFYSSGDSEVRFAPLSVPDGGVTLVLLVLGVGGLAILRPILT